MTDQRGVEQSGSGAICAESGDQEAQPGEVLFTHFRDANKQ
jgi:hypothetical protein